MSDHTDALEHLETLLEDLKRLVGEASDTVDGLPDRLGARAKAYWLAQLTIALDDDHSYLGAGSCTLADTIRELREEAGLPGDPGDPDQGWGCPGCDTDDYDGPGHCDTCKAPLEPCRL